MRGASLPSYRIKLLKGLSHYQYIGHRLSSDNRRQRARDSVIRMIGGLLAMAEAAEYSAIEALRDGRSVEIRALRPDDRSTTSGDAGLESSAWVNRRFIGI